MRLTGHPPSEPYYHNDHLGTPQQLLAKSGAVVWSAVYSAFGEATLTGANGTPTLRTRCCIGWV
ncbi:RHS domain-containing protein [Sinobacterium caligoides]|uniref:RHS domain-containing protein n=1 Tax=Sinobacterium caligoides TaxID=933926 RepID=UPI000F4C600D|nr:RHS domain-containing protein [Sinobacterium caligoides]